MPSLPDATDGVEEEPATGAVMLREPEARDMVAEVPLRARAVKTPAALDVVEADPARAIWSLSEPEAVEPLAAVPRSASVMVITPLATETEDADPASV